MRHSIDLVAFVEAFHDERATNRLRMVEWLEAVRTEARALADLWTRLSLQFEGETLDTAAFENEIQVLLGGQTVIGARLQEFYNRATLAAGGSVEGDMSNGFIHHLAYALI